jgi:hypothetical protein
VHIPGTETCLSPPPRSTPSTLPVDGLSQHDLIQPPTVQVMKAECCRQTKGIKHVAARTSLLDESLRTFRHIVVYDYPTRGKQPARTSSIELGAASADGGCCHCLPNARIAMNAHVPKRTSALSTPMPNATVAHITKMSPDSHRLRFSSLSVFLTLPWKAAADTPAALRAIATDSTVVFLLQDGGQPPGNHQQMLRYRTVASDSTPSTLAGSNSLAVNDTRFAVVLDPHVFDDIFFNLDPSRIEV